MAVKERAEAGSMGGRQLKTFGARVDPGWRRGDVNKRQVETCRGREHKTGHRRSPGAKFGSQRWAGPFTEKRQEGSPSGD